MQLIVRSTLIVFLISVCEMSIPATIPINGVIEGFYWFPSNAINGEYDMFTKKQRGQLLASLGNEINYYFHCPQDREDDRFTMQLWSAQEMRDWSDTVAKASNVHIIIGLRPRRIDSLQKSFLSVQLKLAQLASIGIRYYILCWDDSSGGGTNTQMMLQKDLINMLVRQVTNIELLGIIPAYYAGSQISDGSIVAWANQLSILNQIPDHIRFFATGSTVVPSSIQISDVPQLKNRQFIFFDNWIAVDSNAKVTMTWPPNRHPDIYKASTSISGSVLNLAFPPERIIHQIYALTQRIKSQYSNINSRCAAEFWANYLVTNGFYERDALQQLKTDLQSLIDHGYESNFEVIQHYPFLQRIFENYNVEQMNFHPVFLVIIITLHLLLFIVLFTKIKYMLCRIFHTKSRQ